MRRFFLLIIVLMVCSTVCCQLHALAATENASGYIAMYSQCKGATWNKAKGIYSLGYWDSEMAKRGVYVNQQSTDKHPGISNDGCNLLSYLHLVQYLTNKYTSAEEQLDRLEEWARLAEDPSVAISVYDEYLVNHYKDKGIQRASLESKPSFLTFQSFFDKGGAAIVNIPGHYFIVVGCTTTADGKQYILAVDSSNNSTIKRLKSQTAYEVGSFSKRSYSQIPHDGSARQYWIEYNDFIASDCKVRKAYTSSRRASNSLVTIKTSNTDAYYSVYGASLDPATGNIVQGTTTASLLSVIKSNYNVNGIPVYDKPCASSALANSIVSVKSPDELYKVDAIVECSDPENNEHLYWLKLADNTFVPSEFLEYQYERISEIQTGTYIVSEPGQTQWGYFPFDAHHNGVTIYNGTNVIVAGAVKNRHGSIWYQLDSLDSNKWVYSGHLTFVSDNAQSTPTSQPESGSPYAGWYEVVNVKQYMSIRDKKASSGALISDKAVLGSYVHMTDADAPAGTASKWGHVDALVLKNWTKVAVNGYACVYYMKPVSSTLAAQLEAYEPAHGDVVTPQTPPTTQVSSRINIDSNSVIQLGYKKRLTATTDSGCEVLWTTSDPSIVAISDDGQLFGMRPGIAVVTATASDNHSVSAQCQINVEPPQSNIESISAGGQISKRVQGDYRIFVCSFAPSCSGNYVFESRYDTHDTYGYIYNSSWECLSSDDESGGQGHFRMRFYFEKGQTYYLVARLFDPFEDDILTIGLERDEVIIPISTDYVYGTDILSENGYSYFSFTPEESGKYVFSSSGDFDTLGYLYSNNWYEIVSDDDSGDNLNFAITTPDLSANTTYIFGARFYNASQTGEFNVSVNKYIPEVTSGTCGSDLTWRFVDSALHIEGNGQMTEYTSMESTPWYGLRQRIQTVMVYEGVTSISPYAFSNEYNLEEVYIPSTIQTIGNCAFESCSSLQDIALFEGIKTIGAGAFKDCDSVNYVTIPTSVELIDDGAFSYCDNLETVEFLGKTTSIGNKVFERNVDGNTVNGTVTIRCAANSTAHRYATENGIPFETDEALAVTASFRNDNVRPEDGDTVILDWSVRGGSGNYTDVKIEWVLSEGFLQKIAKVDHLSGSSGEASFVLPTEATGLAATVSVTDSTGTRFKAATLYASIERDDWSNIPSITVEAGSDYVQEGQPVLATWAINPGTHHITSVRYQWDSAYHVDYSNYNVTSYDAVDAEKQLSGTAQFSNATGDRMWLRIFVADDQGFESDERSVLANVQVVKADQIPFEIGFTVTPDEPTAGDTVQFSWNVRGNSDETEISLWWVYQPKVGDIMSGNEENLPTRGNRTISITGSGKLYAGISAYDRKQDLGKAISIDETQTYDASTGTIILPSGIRTIEEEAFRNVPANTFDIPSGVESINASAFDSDAILLVEKDSFAEKWAKSNGFSYKIK